MLFGNFGHLFYLYRISQIPPQNSTFLKAVSEVVGLGISFCLCSVDFLHNQLIG